MSDPVLPASPGAAAPSPPEGVLRTCEFRNSSSPEQVAAGLQFLAAHGCLQSEPNPAGHTP